MQTHKTTQATKTEQSLPQNASISHQANPVEIIQRAQADPSSLTHTDIAILHQTIGNKAVGRLIGGVVQRNSLHQDQSLAFTNLAQVIQKASKKQKAAKQWKKLSKEEKDRYREMVKPIKEEERARIKREMDINKAGISGTAYGAQLNVKLGNALIQRANRETDAMLAHALNLEGDSTLKEGNADKHKV